MTEVNQAVDDKKWIKIKTSKHNKQEHKKDLNVVQKDNNRHEILRDVHEDNDEVIKIKKTKEMDQN